MTTLKAPSPSNLDLSGLDPNLWNDDGVAQASDILIPLSQAANALDDARGQVTINESDTTIASLSEKIILSDGLLSNLVSGSGSLQMELALTTALLNLIATLLGNSDLPVTGLDLEQASLDARLRISGDTIIAESANAGLETHTILQTAGEALAERDLVYLSRSDNKWYPLDADTANLSNRIGYVTEAGGIALDASGDITIRGIISGFSGLTPNQAVFAAIAPGQLTQTKLAPADGGTQIALIYAGEAISATEILLIQTRKLHYMKRLSLAHDATLTINHAADLVPRQRRLSAFVSQTILGSEVAAYADSNQDSDSFLLDATPLTYGIDQCTAGIASASSENFGDADNAFDDLSAGWGSNTVAHPHWLEYDFLVAKTIGQYTLTAESSFVTRTPGTWQLQYWDGSAWQTADTVTGQTWSAGQTRIFTTDSYHSAQRWRLYITNNSGDNANSRLREVEMMEIDSLDSGASQLAQTFNLSSDALISDIDLLLKKIELPAGNVTARIETLVSDDPSGILAHANAISILAESSLGTSYALENFNFSNFLLPAGDYAIVLSSDRAASLTDFIAWGTDESSPSYANGTMKSFDDGLWTDQNKDAIFAINTADIVQDQPLLIGRLGAANTDIESEYADASSLNPDTNTTFKNTTGASIDVTCIVEL